MGLQDASPFPGHRTARSAVDVKNGKPIEGCPIFDWKVRDHRTQEDLWRVSLRQPNIPLERGLLNGRVQFDHGPTAGKDRLLCHRHVRCSVELCDGRGLRSLAEASLLPSFRLLSFAFDTHGPKPLYDGTPALLKVRLGVPFAYCKKRARPS